MAKLDSQDIENLLKPKVSEEEISLNDITSFGDDKSLGEMYGKIDKYNEMLKRKITFINPSLSKNIPLTRENLYLICAFTGSGKTSVSANISYPLYKEQKKILVISNEESSADIIFRIAAIELKLNFNSFKKGLMSDADQERIKALFPAITQYVKIIDVNAKDGATTRIEFIKKLLQNVQETDFACVLIDYFQLIQYSTTDTKKTRYDVLNDLKVYLGQYIKTSNVPIVLFAQLHSMGKRNNKDLDSRIKDCPSIMEPSTVIIEVVPNFKTRVSDFLIIKDRFGLQGIKVTCKFEDGRFEDISDEELVERTMKYSSHKEESVKKVEDEDDNFGIVITPEEENPLDLLKT
jgi:archaellum biogenesis ATPase FlaH